MVLIGETVVGLVLGSLSVVVGHATVLKAPVEQKHKSSAEGVVVALVITTLAASFLGTSLRDGFSSLNALVVCSAVLRELSTTAVNGCGSHSESARAVALGLTSVALLGLQWIELPYWRSLATSPIALVLFLMTTCAAVGLTIARISHNAPKGPADDRCWWGILKVALSIALVVSYLFVEISTVEYLRWRSNETEFRLVSFFRLLSVLPAFLAATSLMAALIRAAFAVGGSQVSSRSRSPLQLLLEGVALIVSHLTRWVGFFLLPAALGPPATILGELVVMSIRGQPQVHSSTLSRLVGGISLFVAVLSLTLLFVVAQVAG
jgi:hypothetical protein